MSACLVNEVYTAVCHPIWDDYFQKYSKEYIALKKDDWQFVKAIAWCESRYQDNAVSQAGAIGIMQIMPSTGLMLGYTVWDLCNAEKNIKCGCLHLANLLIVFNNDRRKVVCAYNCGGGLLQDLISQYGGDWFDHLPGETKTYYRNVVEAYNDLLRCLV